MTKPSTELTLFDLLSRLTFLKAAKLLGAEGERLIAEGGKYDIDIVNQVALDPDEFRLAIESATVRFALNPAARGRAQEIARNGPGNCWWPGRESNPRHADFQAVKGYIGSFKINHLLRLPHCKPSTSRHNPGTPGLSWSHSWHTAITADSGVTYCHGPPPTLKV